MTSSRTDESGRFDHYPDLTWYFGIPPSEIHEMPRPLIRVYIQAIDRLQAQDQLLRIQAAFAPHMKKAAQRVLLRKLERRVQRKVEERQVVEDAPKTEEEFTDRVAASGIAIVTPEEASRA